MLEPKELRIGNWVLINGEVKQVESIGDDWVNISHCQGDLDFEYRVGERYFKNNYPYGHQYFSKTLKPIPITEDILIKAGFKERITNSIKTFYHPDFASFELHKRTEFSTFRAVRVQNEIALVLSERIWYLHEIQNITKALTGKELDINLTSE